MNVTSPYMVENASVFPTEVPNIAPTTMAILSGGLVASHYPLYNVSTTNHVNSSEVGKNTNLR